MKKLFICLLLCVICFPFYANNQLNNKTIDDLQRIKIINEITCEPVKLVLSVLGTLGAGGAVVWSILYGIKTFKQKNDEQRNEYVSGLLESISSENKAKRIGAARAFSRYSDYCVEELIGVLAYEDNEMIRKIIEKNLIGIRDKHINVVIMNNSNTISERMELFGRLTKFSTDEDIAKNTNFVQESFKLLINIHHISYECGQLNQENDTVRNNDFEANKQNTIDSCMSLVNVAVGSGEIISAWIRTGRMFLWPESGLDLSTKNLYGASIKNSLVANSLFVRAIMRHACFINTRISSSDFSFSNLFDLDMKKSKVFASSFFNANLRNSSIVSAKFTACNFSNVILSESNIKQTDILNSVFTNARNRDTHMDQMKIQDCDFTSSELQKMSCVDSELLNSKFYRSDLTKSDFSGSKLIGIKFNGAILLSVVFNNTTIENCDFSGCSVKYVQFKNAVIRDCIFNNVKNNNNGFRNTV